MQNSLPISAPLSLGELLDRAFRLYRARFGSMVLTAAVLVVPFSVLTALVFGFVAVDYFDMLQVVAGNPNADPNEILTTALPGIFAFAGAAGIVGILGLVIQAVVTLALTQQCISALNGENLTWRTAIRLGVRRFWPYVGMAILQVLGIGVVTAVIGGAIGCGVIALVVGGGAAAGLFDGFGETGGAPNAAALVGIGLAVVCMYLFFILLLLIPSTYLSARWVVAAPGLVEQEWGPIEALSRSWALTKGNIWRSIFYVVLLSILSFVITLPVLILQQFVPLAPPQFLGVAAAVSTGIGSVFSVIWQPFYAAAIVLLYYDLRIRHEGFDLVQRIDQLEATQADMAFDTPLSPLPPSPPSSAPSPPEDL